MVQTVNKGLMEALERGGAVVTVNKRLARWLRAEYARRQISAGRSAWETPKAVAVGRWLWDCWERAVAGGAAGADAALIVLSPAQEAAVWERVVRDSAAGRPLMSPERTAAEAARAYKLFHDYRLKPHDLDGASGDVQVFAGWMQEFDALCGREGWLPRVRLAERLEALALGGVRVAEGPVFFAGFDTVTPALAHLKAVLQKKGVAIHDLTAEGPGDGAESRVVRVECATAEEEWDAAARWVRGRLERDPRASLCVVVPDLAASRSRVVRAFRQVLEPESMLAPGESVPSTFNVSVGTPLSGEPMVHAALLALRMAAGPVSVAEASSLLRSPHIGGAGEEAAARAHLDVRMRGWGGLKVSIERLTKDKTAQNTCPDLVKRLKRASGALGLPPLASEQASARLEEWAGKFAAVLDALGWPAARPMSSRERQALAEWRELLAEYEALGAVVGPETASDALARLARLAGERIFQPESPETRVQVLGGLEATGLEFDALWVTGLHDGVSPGAAAPSPFLPLEAQVRAGIRDATAGLRAEFGRRVVQRLLSAAAEVVVSHARRDGDIAQRPSPYVADIGLSDLSGLLLSRVKAPHEILMGCGTTESYDDAMAPPMTTAGVVPGGAYRVKQHSDCPFRAFAQHRLGAEEFDVPTVGLNPMERGLAVHATLEAVWRTLKTSDALRAGFTWEAGGEQPAAMKPELQNIIRDAARVAVRDLQSRRPDLIPTVFDLEHNRLCQIAAEWLWVEVTDREGGFEVVLLEGQRPDEPNGKRERLEAKIGGLKLRGRVDRVDRLEDGRLVIFDYKTSSDPPGAKDFDGPRPREPQLPLYLTAGPWKPEEVAGIYFGILLPGKCAIRGEDDHASAPREEGEPGSAPSQEWLETVDRWRAVLDRMGMEMRDGYAAVDPRDGTVCRRCPLPTLCRIRSVERPDLMEEFDNGEAML
jgi:ATP-dependent helicase/nuclease subunit B